MDSGQERREVPGQDEAGTEYAPSIGIIRTGTKGLSQHVGR